MDVEGAEVGIIDELVDNSLKISGLIFEKHEKLYKPEKNLDYLVARLSKSNYQIIKSDNLIIAQKL